MPSALAALVVSALALVLYRRQGSIAGEEGQEDRPEPPTTVERLVDKRQRMLRFLSTNTQVVFGSRLVVRHLMTPRLETVRPGATIAEIRQLAADKGIHHLLVTEAEESRLLGVISDRDLLARAGKTAGDVMTANPITVAPHMPVSGVLTLLLHKRISCVPVVENERVCGIVTTTDVILALQCMIHALERAGTLTQGMFEEEIELEGTLQVLLRLTEANNASALATAV
jgi:acetoin utilization protein AcuB